MQIQEFINRAAGNTEVIDWIKRVVPKLQTKATYQEIEHVIDFLLSDAAPKRLRRASWNQMKTSADAWTKSLMKKGANITESPDDTKVILELASGNRLVQLIGKAAFEREGFLMRHCVGSYVDKQGVKIFSIRDSANNPHCTIEIKDEEGVEQIKGKGNGPIHPRYIYDVVEVLNHFGLEVRESEMENLGYAALSDELWALLDTSFDNVLDIKINNQRFYYINSNPTRIV